ncbi:TolC family protein [Candidatus Sumerlaeota bacterium]|nr:TolC family protein [Candidatus Sumerlaeota bacterium]
MSHYWLVLLSLPILVGLAGCSNYYEHFEKSADREVYGIIQQKGREVPNMPKDFSIEESTETVFETGASSESMTLSLIDALDIAVQHSREYQSQRESLYTEGLSLSLNRHEWWPIFSSQIDVNKVQDGQAVEVLDANGEGTGKFEGNDVRTRQRNFVNGVRLMLATGADLSLNLATNYFRYASGEPYRTNTSVITGTFTQPLLRGFGPKVARESLTQAERDMVYAIRNYVRFRKQFSVDLAQDYFRLLQQLQTVENQRQNYLRLKASRERDEAMAQYGKIEQYTVDQTRQDELSAHDNWNLAQQNYEAQLDNFKITLGIPMDAEIRLDNKELERIEQEGLNPLKLDEAYAITLALENRLDLRNQREVEEDAERLVDIAKNGLLPGLDFTFDYRNESNPAAPLQPFNFRDEFDRLSYTLELDLRLDKKDDRNSYRLAQIALTAARRDLEARIDRTKQEVREAYRNLLQARSSYEIQRQGLRLAEQRVENVDLLVQYGRAITRDRLEAQRALIDAQNAVVESLVDHHNAQLDLLMAIEGLTIGENGMWEVSIQRDAEAVQTVQSETNEMETATP